MAARWMLVVGTSCVMAACALHLLKVWTVLP